MKYQVPIVYRGQNTYIVEAETPEKAERIARKQWNDGENGAATCAEWEEIERIGTIEVLRGDIGLARAAIAAATTRKES